MSSDVCKHCTDAACLDVCPTGALFRTEFDTVVVQQDICNGCGYCVPACPFGVIDRREDDGRVWKCTLCYDRLKDDQEPACAQACPTELDPVRRARRPARARRATRLESCTAAAWTEARLYGADPDDGVGGVRRVLPAARRARGLRAAARPGRHDARPAARSGRRRGAAAVALGAGIAAAVLGGARERRGATVPRASRVYYGRPVIKAPVWTPEVPVYFFTGGMAGASAGLALAAAAARQRRARAARVG